jgi:hypothetical protein
MLHEHEPWHVPGDEVDNLLQVLWWYIHVTSFTYICHFVWLWIQFNTTKWRPMFCSCYLWIDLNLLCKIIEYAVVLYAVWSGSIWGMGRFPCLSLSRLYYHTLKPPTGPSWLAITESPGLTLQFSILNLVSLIIPRWQHNPYMTLFPSLQGKNPHIIVFGKIMNQKGHASLNAIVNFYLNVLHFL